MPRSDAEVVTPALLRGWPLPPPGEDKGDRGSVLVVGGAAQTPGAAMLAGLAALRAGAGKLQLAVAEPVAAAVAVAVPEALVLPLPASGDGGSVDPSAASALHDLAVKADVVCVGPGLDDADRSAQLVTDLLGSLGEETGVVFDAYALGALPGQEKLCATLAGRLVLTPNAGEAGILLEQDAPSQYGPAARMIAERYSAVVALRGAIATPEGKLYLDGAGQAGLGTSGSGDVLAGVVAGLLARGATPDQATVWGAHVHATAGERLAARVGPLGYLARELLDETPSVLTELSVQY
jgi:ADP-dependent NAD(P)H-hydrate dehydratase